MFASNIDVFQFAESRVFFLHFDDAKKTNSENDKILLDDVRSFSRSLLHASRTPGNKLTVPNAAGTVSHYNGIIPKNQEAPFLWTKRSSSSTPSFAIPKTSSRAQNWEHQVKLKHRKTMSHQWLQLQQIYSNLYVIGEDGKLNVGHPNFTGLGLLQLQVLGCTICLANWPSSVIPWSKWNFHGGSMGFLQRESSKSSKIGTKGTPMI